MHNRNPTFMSYDFYTFILSLMFEPKIYEFARHHPESAYMEIWNEMWHPDDLGKVNGIVHLASSDTSLEQKVKLSFINNKIGFNNLRLKKDVSFLKQMLEIHIEPVECLKINRMLNISKDEHVCVQKCRKSKGWRGGNKCVTNKFHDAVQGNLEWDWCEM